MCRKKIPNNESGKENKSLREREGYTTMKKKTKNGYTWQTTNNIFPKARQKSHIHVREWLIANKVEKKMRQSKEKKKNHRIVALHSHWLEKRRERWRKMPGNGRIKRMRKKNTVNRTKCFRTSIWNETSIHFLDQFLYSNSIFRALTLSTFFYTKKITTTTTMPFNFTGWLQFDRIHYCHIHSACT